MSLPDCRNDHEAPSPDQASGLVLRRHFMWSAVSMGLMLGCTPQKKEATTDPISLLQKPTTTSHSIAVEYARVLVPSHRRRLLEELWKHSDQQSIPFATRMQLTPNAIRIGVLGQTLPPPLRSLLQPIPIAEDQLNDLQRQMLTAGLLKPEDVVHDHTRLSLKYGQPRDLEVCGSKETLHWVWQSDQGRSQRRFKQVTAKVRVAVDRELSGSVVVNIEPLASYGPMLPQFANAMNQDANDPFHNGLAQQQTPISEAGGKASLQLGETLLFGPSFDLSGRSETPRMGEVFFQNEGGTPGDWLVLLRMIESRFNDLFVS
ncbi:MAG: hypothetical protein JNK57_18130 [Planctomycetaceae bacterium]|nr:hypothetical protein [Planctomycetaceae bacterium]